MSGRIHVCFVTRCSGNDSHHAGPLIDSHGSEGLDFYSSCKFSFDNQKLCGWFRTHYEQMTALVEANSVGSPFKLPLVLSIMMFNMTGT